MPKIKQFCHYWRENITAAKEGHEIVVLVVFTVWQAVYLSSKYWGFEVAGDIHPKALDIVEIASIVFFAAWCLLWLPFKRHVAQEQKHADETAVLTAKLNDRVKQKEIEKKLGDYHERIGKRVAEITRMSQYNYIPKYKESYEKRVFDSDTAVLLDEIAAFLVLNVEGAARSIFLDEGNMKLPMSSGPIDLERAYWVGVVCMLEHRGRQLMKVIETCIQSSVHNT